MEKKRKSDKSKEYELLAPVGDFAMLNAAINAGADAVYFGLKNFTMRQGAKNFKLSEVSKIKRICDKAKVKKYITLNSIVYDNELRKLERIIKKIRKKVDAVICWDLAVINLCKKYNVPFFISTQASVSNVEAATFYKSLGAKRIILARELNLEQVKKIAKIIDVEVFCHGAMCVSISGRCLMSQFLFNKSANRGECIHPCRRSYIIKDKQEGYELEVDNDKVLSAKDLCTLPFIEKLKRAGIKSFKIEGRNRDPRYVDAVVRVYRRALDKRLTKEDIKRGMNILKKIYNREFSSGFFLKMPTADDFARVEHSAATEYKHFVGKITHYFNKIGVATIKLVSELNNDDKIVIIGKTTGIVRAKVRSMERKKQPIKRGFKGQEVGIDLSDFPKVRKNDEVYVIKQR
jgi:putative protease